MNKYPEHPRKNEERFVDWDNDSGGWGVFGIESGFCYALFADEKEAIEWLAVRNNFS